jgi:hypothetical protein
MDVSTIGKQVNIPVPDFGYGAVTQENPRTRALNPNSKVIAV